MAKDKRVMVAVKESTKNKVAKRLAGTGFTIGWFFDVSANEMLKPENRINLLQKKQKKESNSNL